MIDRIASRYGCLPSEVLGKGDVFDLFVIETVLDYERYLDDKEKLGKGEITPTNQHYLQDMMNKVKGATDAR